MTTLAKIAGDIIRYESGELNGEEVRELFQALIDNNYICKLQGAYGRTAATLIAAGEINPPQREAYGSH